MPSSWTKSTVAALRDGLFGSRLYDISLRGNRSLDVSPIPVAFPGDGTRSATREMREFSALLETIQSGNASKAAHRFDWIGDLAASGMDTAAGLARRITSAWIQNYGRWGRLAWQPDVLSERITNWLLHYEFLVSGGRADFRENLHKAISRQVLHEKRVLRFGGVSEYGMAVAKGLVHAGIAIRGDEAALRAGLRLIDTSVDADILPDGGHRSRNPSVQVSTLATLIQIREAVMSRHVQPRDKLNNAIDRMVPMLRSFRHGDGGLAIFNGSLEGEAVAIDSVLRKSGAKGRAVVNARHSGFQRLKCGQTLLIVDAGTAPAGFRAHGSHAGTLAFEMSVGKNRVIVNCGQPGSDGGELREALRRTPAHSTLAIGETDSSELLDKGGFGTRQACSIESVRREIDGNVLVELGHDGYLESFGATHRRSLYLSSKGDDVRGEDRVTADGVLPLTVRFHLHPAVKASVLGDEFSILLRFGRRSCWRFLADGSSVALEESIYFGGGDRRKTGQIVLRSNARSLETTVKWRIKRES